MLFDIDGDDTLEVILGQRLYPSGRVLVFRHDGSTYPGWPQSFDYMCVATPSVADVDADSIMEICAVSYYSVYLWDKDGNTKPGWPRLNVAGGMSYAPFAIRYPPLAIRHLPYAICRATRDHE